MAGPAGWERLYLRAFGRPFAGLDHAGWPGAEPALHYARHMLFLRSVPGVSRQLWDAVVALVTQHRLQRPVLLAYHAALQRHCRVCFRPRPGKKCGRCRAARYCSAGCQRADWDAHRPACTAGPGCPPAGWTGWAALVPACAAEPAAG